jgi:F420-non-reducing hydrogenase iron-sulfur subunit
VFIGGCRLGECNYVTQGNYDALGNTLLTRKILAHIGLNPEKAADRLHERQRRDLFGRNHERFGKKIRDLGPLGKGEGEDGEGYKFKLDAVRKLVPYLRLVERERLRVPVKSEKPPTASSTTAARWTGYSTSWWRTSWP